MNLPPKWKATLYARRSQLLLGAFGLLVVLAGAVVPLFLPSVRPPTENRKDTMLIPNPSAADRLPGLRPAPPTEDFGPIIRRLVVGTLLVSLMCAGTLWACARWLKKETASLSGKQLHVLASVPVAGRCRVFLVQAGPQRILAGVDAGGLKAVVGLPNNGAGLTTQVLGPLLNSEASIPPVSRVA